MKIRQDIQELWASTLGWLREPIYSMGQTHISILSVLSFIFFTVLIIWVANRIRSVFVMVMQKRYHMDRGVADAFGTISKYVVIIIGFFVLIDTSGVDLSSLQVLLGALGVGIGLGLQSITNNFISGIIILFERPIKVGDRVDVGGLEGNVTSISARATTVITNDNVSVIVPNSDFITKQVVNWSYNDRIVRFRYPVGVSFREDPEKVRRALLEVVEENPHVLKNPKSDVLFDSFGESALNFTLRVWTTEYADRPKVMKSELYYAIFRKFKERGIEIPYPQRDVHIRSNDAGIRLKE